MAIYGSVQITGFIAPTSSGDTYATHDAYYGRDGLRNVDFESDLDGITALRRKAGMIVGVSGGTKHYRLLPEPWAFNFNDWAVAFVTPENIVDYDTYVTGFTFNTGTYDLTIQQNDISPLTVNLGILAGDIRVTGGTYDPNTGSATFYNNSGGSFVVTGFMTGYTDNYVTGGTYNPNSGLINFVGTPLFPSFNVDLSALSGLGNRWYIPSGVTVTVKNDFQSFIYGDLILEGVIDTQSNGQLVVLNGNLIMSGGTIIGSGTTSVIQLPDFDTKVTNLSLSGGVLTLTQNDLTTFSVSIPTTPIFSGGSGNCITDLYISNLYGCSPITIHDNIQNVGSTVIGLSSNSFGSGNTVNSDFSNINGGLNSVISAATYSSIAGGLSNKIYSSKSHIGGGDEHTIGINADRSIIAGGWKNTIGGTVANSRFSFIGAGDNNTVTGYESFIVAGFANNVSGNYSGTFGTQNNVAGNGSSALGGSNNTVTSTGLYSTVGGGMNNMIRSPQSFIGGGRFNTIHSGSSYSSIGGGKSHLISVSTYSTIGGGIQNTVSSGSHQSLIGGGRLNSMTGSSMNSVIVGGQQNRIKDSKYSTIVGGYGNTVDFKNWHYMFIGGGKNNTVKSQYGIIVGGIGNYMTGNGSHGYSAIIGGGGFFGNQGNKINSGNRNFIGVGLGNYINYTGYAVIINGQYNTNSGGNGFIGTGTYNTIGSAVGYGFNASAFIGTGSHNQVKTPYNSIINGRYNNLNQNGNISHKFSTIVNGYFNTINSASYSSIIGGRYNLIMSGISNSHIIGSNITASTSNTTYVNSLNIKNLAVGSSVYNLGIDASGFVVTGSTGMVSAPALSAVTAVGYTTTTDIEITDYTKGVILRSPDNTRWRVTVDNSGSLVTTIVP